MNSTKRVLIPAYYFPPHGSVGVFRIAKFIEYLPKFGWEPYVITINTDYYQNTESVHEFPQIFEVLKELERTAIFGGDLISRGLRFLGSSETVETNTLQAVWVPSLIQRLSEAIRDYDIDVILASGGPFLPLTALPVVNFRTGTPYIVDLRDPWVRMDEGTRHMGFTSRVRDLLAETFEPRVIDSAANVITVTEKMSSQYRERYPDYCYNINTIHNSYDPSDFEDIERELSDRFRITYPGKWYGRESARTFLEPFARFVEDYDAELIHYGKMGSEIRALIEDLGLQDRIFPRGYVDRETVAATAKGSNVGLVISRSPKALSTKVFDFIGCDVPIIAVSESESTLESFVKDFNHGYTVNKESPDEIYSVLKDLWKTEPSSLGKPSYVSEYAIKSTTEELSTLLERAADD